MKTIAVDFDGTITEYSVYPIIGNVRKEIPNFLNKLKQEGYRLVLYTARSGEFYKEAIELLKKSNLYDMFDWKYLEDHNNYGTYGKIKADLYLDDRALLLNMDTVDWDNLFTKILLYI